MLPICQRCNVFLAVVIACAGVLQAQPVVAAGGILNAASLVKGQPVTLGSFVAIFGSGFGNGGVTGTVPWPTSLGGTSVTMNGVLAPLYAVTDGQINAQVPFEALPAGQTSGTVNVIVQPVRRSLRRKISRWSPSHRVCSASRETASVSRT